MRVKTRNRTKGGKGFRPVPGRDYRFTVGSAKEAVAVIREHLGPSARVCSVKQIEGKGLSRFLSSPRLEVVAKIPADSEETPVAATPAANPERPEAKKWVSDAEASPVVPDEGREDGSLAGMLRRAGFSRAFLTRVCEENVGAHAHRGLTGRMLRDIAASLTDAHRRAPVPPLGQRVAFIGCPGVGKTTALCKWLASEIFLREKRARVLIRDGDRPNMSGPLDVFCEVLGAPVARSLEAEQSLAEDERLYFDLPGFDLRSSPGIREMEEMLDREFITGRVLVLNSAYDGSILRETCAAGSELGATHIVFTHTDEVRHWGKLLETAVCAGVPPLFLSSGQDVAGGIDEKPFDRLVRETFPFTAAVSDDAAEETLQRSIA